MSSEDIEDMVHTPLSVIATALFQMNHRVETDPGARDFKSKQVRQSITGTTLNALMQVNDDKLKINLLKATTPFDSHLALKNAKDVNCHSTGLQRQTSLSALALHDKESICNNCVEEYPIQFNSSPANPFRCWRRGHSSSNYGFLYNLLLKIDQRNKSWRLSKTKRLQTSAALKYRLDNMGKTYGQEMFSSNRIDAYGRSMMVVMTIRLEELEVSDGTSELASLLSSQLLASKHIANTISGKKSPRGSREELKNIVAEVLDRLNHTWKYSPLSARNSTGILSGTIVYRGEKDAAEELLGSMRHYLESSNSEILKYENISSDVVRGMFGFDKKTFDLQQSDVAVCLFLDPIVDLAVSLE